MMRLSKVRSLFTAAGAAALTCALAACDSGTNHGDPGAVELGGGNDAGAQRPVDAATVIDAGTFTINPTKPNFQTKSAAQLLSSIKACFGGSTAMVTADMIQGGSSTSPVLPAGFLTSTGVGSDDIVTQQKGAFDGDATLLRLGTRPDSLTLEYVTAQRNVANVVATNCSLASAGPLCNCATLPDATSMMRRCMPQLDPTSPDLVNAAQTLQTRCATNKGQAIASFVASAALSKLP